MSHLSPHANTIQSKHINIKYVCIEYLSESIVILSLDEANQQFEDLICMLFAFTLYKKRNRVSN